MTASAKASRSPISAPLPSRREFLSYALIASVGLAGAASCGGIAWFLQQQKIGSGTKSGLFLLDFSNVPKPSDPPVFVRDAMTWLANINGDLVAYSNLCPFETCQIVWSEYFARFECPCCGSKFQIDGTYIWGASPRNLDQFVLQVTANHTTFSTPDDGAPVPMRDAQSIVLNINRLIPGKPRPPRLNS
ncbi:MAG TPA: Rieske 2Fe-2S domain-containing protein [Phototrophicaceae bacterium]|nr:Rieske 2Fe-2S domain-containing protein [Phototrophicaceae bacterium]